MNGRNISARFGQEMMTNQEGKWGEGEGGPRLDSFLNDL